MSRPCFLRLIISDAQGYSAEAPALLELVYHYATERLAAPERLRIAIDLDDASLVRARKSLADLV